MIRALAFAYEVGPYSVKIVVVEGLTLVGESGEQSSTDDQLGSARLVLLGVEGP